MARAWCGDFFHGRRVVLFISIAGMQAGSLLACTSSPLVRRPPVDAGRPNACNRNSAPKRDRSKIDALHGPLQKKAPSLSERRFCLK